VLTTLPVTPRIGPESAQRMLEDNILAARRRKCVGSAGCRPGGRHHCAAGCAGGPS
jgi:hypothetical protein